MNAPNAKQEEYFLLQQQIRTLHKDGLLIWQIAKLTKCDELFVAKVLNRMYGKKGFISAH